MTIDEAIEQFKYDAECNRADLDISYAEENEQIAEWLEELKQYWAIGTIEECREAVEKMKPKKTAIEAIKVHICPVCGFGGIYDYCGNCGQRVQMLSD